MFNFLRNLFCTHDYGILGRWDCNYSSENSSGKVPVPIYFFECTKCHKRTVIKERDFYYNTHALELIRMWLKRHIQLNFDEDGQPSIGVYKENDEDY